MLDEGYIKFKPDWKETPAFSGAVLDRLVEARQQLFQLKLIGAYPSGIGYGNISHSYPVPENGNAFLISGSATGNIELLETCHFSLVTRVDIDQNKLYCQGPIIASSESMSHAVIYRECPEVKAVVHIHDLAMWQQLLHQVPTTDATATYGTPEMALSIIDLLNNSNLKQTGLFVMEGHEEGIFAFGKSLEEAVKIILNSRKLMGF
jgi:L-ribulose-5-phosphate 4-epimerase